MRKHTQTFPIPPYSLSRPCLISPYKNLLFFSSVCTRPRACVCVCRSVSKKNPPSQINFFFFTSIDENTHQLVCVFVLNVTTNERPAFCFFDYPSCVFLYMPLFVVIIPLFSLTPMCPICLSHF
jgi:hypothetical protein